MIRRATASSRLIANVAFPPPFAVRVGLTASQFHRRDEFREAARVPISRSYRGISGASAYAVIAKVSLTVAIPSRRAGSAYIGFPVS